MILGIVCLPFLLFLSGPVAAVMGKSAYKWLTDEDGCAEYMQIVFLAVAFVLGVVIVRRLWNRGEKTFSLLYLVVSLGFFFVVGEEISWGQRIFGWATPESIIAISKQPETNIHNLYAFWGYFKLVQLLAGAYGTFLPLLFLVRWPVVARYRKALSLLVPHYVLIPYFFFLFIWRIYRTFFEPWRKHYFAVAQFNEVLELIVYVGAVLFMVYLLRAASSPVSNFPRRGSTPPQRKE